MSLDTLIAGTRKALADDAAKAHVVFTAQGTLVGVTEVDIRTGAHSFKVDEPALAGRRQRRREPGAVRAGVARSCQAITYRIWAAQLGVELDSITVRVEGDLDLRGFFGVDDGVRPGLSAVRVEVTVAGPESEERYAELAAAVDEHCPVLDLFKNPVPVSRALVTWVTSPAEADVVQIAVVTGNPKPASRTHGVALAWRWPRP